MTAISFINNKQYLVYVAQFPKTVIVGYEAILSWRCYIKGFNLWIFIESLLYLERRQWEIDVIFDIVLRLKHYDSSSSLLKTLKY